MTALGVAASRGHLDVVTFLIEAGADIHKARNDGMTALGMAAAEGHFDIVRLLLEHGADVHSAGRGLDLALDMWKSFIC
jgi:ankyrin repeat protein